LSEDFSAITVELPRPRTSQDLDLIFEGSNNTTTLGYLTCFWSNRAIDKLVRHFIITKYISFTTTGQLFCFRS